MSNKNESYDDFVRRMQELMNRPFDTVTPSRPDRPDYTKMELDNRSDDELAYLAKAQQEEYRQQNINAINNTELTGTKSLNTQRESADRLLQEREAQIDETHQAAQSNLNNQLLRRGLSRSSIAANTSARLEENRADAINTTQQYHSNQIADIEGRLADLTAQRQQALDQFDIRFAARLTTAINDLTQTRDRHNAESIRFNNAVLQQINNDHSTNLINTEREIALNQAAQERQQQERQQELFNQSRIMLATMSTQEARRRLENDPIFRNLPQHMHTALFREFVR